MHKQTSHTTRSCDRVSKTDNSTRSAKDAVRESELETDGISEKLDTYLSNNAVNIDRLDQDKHYLLNWINSIQKELIDDSQKR